VLLAVAGPVVQKVVDVHFEILELVLGHVGHVVLQLVHGGQLGVRHHAALLVQAPYDVRCQPAGARDILLFYI